MDLIGCFKRPLLGRLGVNRPNFRTNINHCSLFSNLCRANLEDGFEEESHSLQSATVHWLRHTGISDDVKIRPREHVRDDAGHSSSLTTDRYIDIDLRERHASGKKERIDK